MELILGTFSLTNLKEIEISVNIEEGNLKDYLIASASFPSLKHQIKWEKYLDEYYQ